jgi:O-antigen ligase
LFFIFVIPFESLDLSFITGTLSLSRVAGLLFFACFLFFYNPLNSVLPGIRAFPRIPDGLWGFFGYFAVYALSGFFIAEEFFRPFLGRLVMLIQLLVFFWVGSSLLEDKSLAIKALLVFSVGTSLLAVGMVFGLPGFSEQVGGRVTSLGYNANDLARMLSMAALILTGLILNRFFRGMVRNSALAGLTLCLLLALGMSASRGGIAAFAIGCVFYMLPYWRSNSRVIALTLAACILLGTVYVVILNPTASTRWRATFEQGDLTGRDNIWSAAKDMFSESPVVGWQPFEFQAELGRRLGKGATDAHNLYVHLVLEVGVAGAVPFFIGLCSLGFAAWRARKGVFGLLPIGLVVSTLAGNMSGTALVRKPLWFVMAFVAATVYTATKRRMDPNLNYGSVFNYARLKPNAYR